MNPTTHAILQSVLATDATLSLVQRLALQDLVNGRAPCVSDTQSGPMLLTQKEAARILGVSRVTLWRMTCGGAFKRVEVVSGTWRYQRAEVEAIARGESAKVAFGRICESA